MNERIKLIRKSLRLTQQGFADRLGVKRNTVASYEGGKMPNNAVIIGICREFGINEQWLRTGEGEMYPPPPRDELDALAKRYGLSPGDIHIIEKFVTLKEAQRGAIVDYMVKTGQGVILIER